jgi:hypothetical protein
MLKKLIISLTFTLFSLPSIAVDSAPRQNITNLRVEGSAGFIGFDTTFSSPSSCKGKRVWVDLTDEVGRVKYSTALMAFAADKPVNIRANTSSTDLLFGACRLYDIYVTK